MNTLRLLTLHILEHNPNGVFGKGLLDTKSGQMQETMITIRWSQTFCDRFRIISRSQSGKLKMSPEKTVQLEEEMERHLGRLNIGFNNGKFVEDDIGNADETHFQFDMTDGKTLGFTNDEEVRYADMTSGSEGMTLLLRIIGGRNARIETPFLIFKNKDRRYAIRGVPGNIPGVVYRTAPKLSLIHI